MNRSFDCLLFLIFLTACAPFESIPYSPAQTPETWLHIQPFSQLQFGSQIIYIIQPSTSLIVYLLGLLTIGVGIYFLAIQDKQRSRWWWGITLLLWAWARCWPAQATKHSATRSNAPVVRPACGPVGGKLPTCW